MKLLFDENLSPKLEPALQQPYPGSAHARSLGLKGSDDAALWEYALRHGFAIVSKDNDFRQRSFLEGAPPKIVWLSVGNAGTQAILKLLRREGARLEAFDRDSEQSLLVLRMHSEKR